MLKIRVYSTSHTCEVQSFLVLGVRSSEFGGSILSVPHESEKPYIKIGDSTGKNYKSQ